MADSYEALEGDVEELEGDADFMEWTTEKDCVDVGDQAVSSKKLSLSQLKDDKKINRSAASMVEKLKGLVKSALPSSPKGDNFSSKSVTSAQQEMPALQRKRKHKDSTETEEKRLDKKHEKDFSEEDCRLIDTWLVDEMIENIQNSMIPKRGDKYTVRFGPVEIADLAESSVQELVKSQLNCSFFFRRQVGKFKKKKGYAEAYFSSAQEASTFIQALAKIKLVDKCIEVTISAAHGRNSLHTAKFLLKLTHRSKLLKLIRNNQDSSVKVLNVPVEKQIIENIPENVPVSIVRVMFPFLLQLISPPHKPGSQISKQPFTVVYASNQWAQAVSECICGYSVNGIDLHVHSEVKHEENLRQSAKEEDVKKGTTGAQENKPLVDQTAKDGETEKRKETMDMNSETDDAISSMTRDVCADMLESLNKLKQLETDNPNVLKILEMQTQLAKLSQSLQEPTPVKSSEADQGISGNAKANPWEVNPSDIKGKDQDGNESERSRQSKEEKKKQAEESRLLKQRQEMENLQRMIEEADEAERQKEERAKQQREMEVEQKKGQEERRKLVWARRIITDAKQGGKPVSTVAKLEAEKLLKAREERIRQEAEENARKAEEERMKIEEAKKAEEARIKMEEEKRRKEESKAREEEKRWKREKQKEEERRALVQEIEKGRQENNSIPESHLQWNPHASKVSPGISRESPARGRSSHQKHKAERAQSFRTKTDDGIDDRLAAFERELAQKGVISPPKKSEHKAESRGVRQMFKGTPVYLEEEINDMKLKGKGEQSLPADYYIQLSFHPNRQCPVMACPAVKVFKTLASFLDHWTIFHTPEVTMRFCQNCSAYFMQIDELQRHLEKRHGITDSHQVDLLINEARVKVVSNPSFRNPHHFLPPLL